MGSYEEVYWGTRNVSQLDLSGGCLDSNICKKAIELYIKIKREFGTLLNIFFTSIKIL